MEATACSSEQLNFYNLWGRCDGTLDYDRLSQYTLYRTGMCRPLTIDISSIMIQFSLNLHRYKPQPHHNREASHLFLLCFCCCFLTRLTRSFAQTFRQDHSFYQLFPQHPGLHPEHRLHTLTLYSLGVTFFSFLRTLSRSDQILRS